MAETSSSTERKKRSGSDKRKRDIKMYFRVDEEEKAKILRNAANANLEKSSFMREQSLKESARKTKKAKPPVEQKELVRLLGKVGKLEGHYYQIVRAINFHHEGIERAFYEEATNDIKEIKKAILDSLGREPLE